MRLFLVITALCVSARATSVKRESEAIESSSGSMYIGYQPSRDIARAKPLSQIPEHQREYACTMDNVNYYEHGDKFHADESSKCITFRCEWGSYQLYEEGCMNTETGQCHPVGHTFNIRCHTFLCTKTVENGMHRYEGVRTRIGCYDSLTRSCRREHELFPQVDEDGVYREKCSCRIRPGYNEIVCF